MSSGSAPQEDKMTISDDGILHVLPPVCDEIDALLRNSNNIIVTTHYGMDGDAVGSVVALFEALTALGKKVRTVNPTPTPYNYKFIAPDGTFAPEIIDDCDFDLIVCLDAANGERIKYPASLEKKVPLINIDHHLGNTKFGSVNWIDGDSPCVSSSSWSCLMFCSIPNIWSSYFCIPSSWGAERSLIASLTSSIASSKSLTFPAAVSYSVSIDFSFSLAPSSSR